MSVEQQGKSRAPESGPAFDVPIFILDLIESFIKANASVLAVTVEDDRPNGVLKILTEDKSPRLHTISDTSRSGSPRSVGDPAGDLRLDRLRESVNRAGGILHFERNPSGEPAVAATVRWSSVKGDLSRDLGAMLSSVVCTNPDLDLTFDFRIGKQASAIRVSEITDRIPEGKTGGLTVARAVQGKIKAALEAFEKSTGRRYSLNYSICPFCSCGCQVIPRKSIHGDLTGVAPLRRHPVSNGSLCIRGWNSHEYVSHADRLKGPLIRKDSRLTPCTWGEALGKTASDLQRILDKWGPDSIGFIGSPRCSNEDNYLLMKLARCVVGTGNLDTGPRLSLFPVLDALFDSLGAGAATASLDTVERAGLILAVGADLSGCAPMVFSRICRALQNKADVFVADPRRSKLAKQATHHWAVRPGSDLYWINGVLAYLLGDRKLDAGSAGHPLAGLAELEEAMREWSLSRAERETGIPADSLRLFADRLVEAENAVCILGSGIGAPGLLKQTAYGLVNLALVSGHAGRRGSGILVAGGENNTQGAWDMGVSPDRLPGGMPVHPCDPGALDRLQLGRPPVAGRDFQGMMRGVLSGEIRGLYVMGENPTAYCGDPAFLDALGRLEMLAVQEIFPNPLTRIATVVLPALAMYERAGTCTNLEHRVQPFEPIAERTADARPDWEILQGVAEAMGAGFAFPTVDAVSNEIAARVPGYEGADAQALSRTPGGVLWPEHGDGGGGRPWLRPDWRGILHPAFPEEADRVRPDEQFPVVLIFGRLQSFWNTGARSSRSALLDREETHAALHLSPEDAKTFQVRAGARVRVVFPSGSVQTSVVLTKDLPRGVAFLPAHPVGGKLPLCMKNPVPARVEPCR